MDRQNGWSSWSCSSSRQRSPWGRDVNGVVPNQRRDEHMTDGAGWPATRPPGRPDAPDRQPLTDRAAQGIQECSPPDRIAVSVLGQQPRRRGVVRTGRRPPRPALSAEDFPSHPVLSSSVRCRHLVRKPGRVLSRAGTPVCGSADRHHAGRQLPPRFFIRAVISRPSCPVAEAWTQDHSGRLY